MSDEKSIFQYEGIAGSEFTTPQIDLSASISDNVGTSVSPTASTLPPSTVGDGKTDKNPNAVHVRRYVIYLKKG